MLQGCRIVAKMPEFCTFAPMSKKKQDITQKAAIVKALEEHGGRARLSDIYPRVIELAMFKEGSDKEATIRATMQRHPELFRHSPDKPDGWWELVSYQEDIASRDNCIAELKAKLAEKEEEIAEWKRVPTEDDFVKKFVKETKHFFKHDRKKADIIRQIMIKVGRYDADKELDSWIDGKEQSSAAQAIQKQTEALLKVVERPTTQNIHGDIIQGDKVAEKTLIPSVGNYKPQITTQNIETPMPSTEQHQKQNQLEDE